MRVINFLNKNFYPFIFIPNAVGGGHPAAAGGGGERRRRKRGKKKKKVKRDGRPTGGSIFHLSILSM